MRGMGQRAGRRGRGRERERETEGEGNERRLRGKGDTQVTFYFLLSFHIQMYWLVRYSNMVAGGILL